MLREHSRLKSDPGEPHFKADKVRGYCLGFDAKLSLVRNTTVLVDHAQVHRSGGYIQSCIVYFCHHRNPFS